MSHHVPARGDAFLTRRRLLQLAATAAAAWAADPWLPAQARAQPAAPRDPATVATLEAFADTLIPGPKRDPADRAVAGVSDTPGAVAAGAVDLLHFPAAGTATVVPAIAAGLNARAAGHAATRGVVLDPTVPPLVALDFDERTALLVEALDDRSNPDQPVWEAAAALVFLSFHTAGHLPTATAVREGHPGLAAIAFPHPGADGLWRFPDHSYGRRLARPHPATTERGHPS